MFCTQCGKQNPEQAKFCYSCGGQMTRLVAVGADAAGTAAPNIEANRPLTVSDVSQATTPGLAPSRFSPIPWFFLGAMVLFLARALSVESDSQPPLMLAIFVCYYILLCYALMSVARRVRASDRWRAWVPIFQTTLLCDLALVSQVWFFILFVPLVNLIVLAWLWFRIFKRTAMSSGWAAVMWVPFVNAPLLAYLASRRVAEAHTRAFDTDPVGRSAGVSPETSTASTDLDDSSASTEFPTGIVSAIGLAGGVVAVGVVASLLFANLNNQPAPSKGDQLPAETQNYVPAVEARAGEAAPASNRAIEFLNQLRAEQAEKLALEAANKQQPAPSSPSPADSGSGLTDAADPASSKQALKVGDRVRLPPTRQDAMANIIWSPGMDAFLGMVGKVTRIDKDGTLRIDIDQGTYWWAVEWVTPTAK